MKKPITYSWVLLAILVSVVSKETVATLVEPDAEFEFAASINDSKESTALVAPSLVAMGFSDSGENRETKDGRFRVIFKRGTKAEVTLMGRAECVRVGIYTSGRDKEAQRIKQVLVEYLQTSVPNLLLFKASGCEKEL